MTNVAKYYHWLARYIASVSARVRFLRKNLSIRYLNWEELGNLRMRPKFEAKIKILKGILNGHGPFPNTGY